MMNLDNQKYGANFYKAYNEYAGDVLSPEIIRLAKSYIHGKVLDVGAGSGAMLKFLKKIKTVETAMGIDIAPKTDEIIEASASEMPFEDEMFDCVIASEVFEHLDDNILEKAVREIYRVLKSNGILIVTTPYKYDLSKNLVTCPHCGEMFDRWGEVRSFDKLAMLNTIGKKRFIIHKMETIPLGFMASHSYLRYLTLPLKKIGFLKDSETLFVVAEKEISPSMRNKNIIAKKGQE